MIQKKTIRVRCTLANEDHLHRWDDVIHITHHRGPKANSQYEEDDDDYDDMTIMIIMTLYKIIFYYYYALLTSFE